jgi:hypothetical protein
MPALGSQQDYLNKLPVFVNGTALEEVTQVEATLDTGLTEIITNTKGLAGFASGAKKVTINVTGVVPISGLEQDFWNWAHDEEWVTMQVGCGRGDFSSNGKLQNVSIKGGVGSAVEVSFQWVGAPGKIE